MDGDYYEVCHELVLELTLTSYIHELPGSRNVVMKSADDTEIQGIN